MTTRCSTHQTARAAWTCLGCDRTLCPECAYLGSAQKENLIVCVHCGGFGRVITRPKRIAPFWEMFPKFLGAIFSGAGLIQIFAISLFMYGASWVPLMGGLIASFIYVSYFFRIISS